MRLAKSSGGSAARRSPIPPRRPSPTSFVSCERCLQSKPRRWCSAICMASPIARSRLPWAFPKGPSPPASRRPKSVCEPAWELESGSNWVLQFPQQSLWRNERAKRRRFRSMAGAATTNTGCQAERPQPDAGASAVPRRISPGRSSYVSSRPCGVRGLGQGRHRSHGRGARPWHGGRRGGHHRQCQPQQLGATGRSTGPKVQGRARTRLAWHRRVRQHIRFATRHESELGPSGQPSPRRPHAGRSNRPPDWPADQPPRRKAQRHAGQVINTEAQERAGLNPRPFSIVTGFSGLLVAFRRGDQVRSIDLFHLRGIAETGLSTALIALMTIAVATLSGDLRSATRILAAFVLAFIVFQIIVFAWRQRRLSVRTPWPHAVVAVGIDLAAVALAVVTIVLRAVGIYEALLLLLLARPMWDFVRVLRDIA